LGLGLAYTWPWYGWGGAYYDPYYYPGYYSAPVYPGYSDYPPAIGAVEPPPAANWHYCDDPQGYYPYVQSCNHQWQIVPAVPPGAGLDAQPSVPSTAVPTTQTPPTVLSAGLSHGLAGDARGAAIAYPRRAQE
jgi:hypothetical protein